MHDVHPHLRQRQPPTRTTQHDRGCPFDEPALRVGRGERPGRQLQLNERRRVRTPVHEGPVARHVERAHHVRRQERILGQSFDFEQRIGQRAAAHLRARRKLRAAEPVRVAADRGRGVVRARRPAARRSRDCVSRAAVWRRHARATRDPVPAEHIADAVGRYAVVVAERTDVQPGSGRDEGSVNIPARVATIRGLYQSLDRVREHPQQVAAPACTCGGGRNIRGSATRRASGRTGCAPNTSPEGTHTHA